MKKLTQLLFVLFCLCLPTMLHAQKDDSKYLAGAVPEVDGKVVFSKEFSIPGMSQDEIYNRLLKWMDARLKVNENNSRVVYSKQEKGQIVGIGDEWIIFSSTALSLDKTQFLYQLTAICQPEKCILEVDKIRFNYREGKEKYTAEEWITDKYALNKKKTKLIRGLAKWRRKTVDFADDLYLSAAEALNITTSNTSAEKNRGEIANVPATYKEIEPNEIPADAIQTGTGKLVVIIGEEPFNITMMTANAGGSLGKVSGKTVIFSILSPEQPYEQMDKAENYTVRFYPNGQTEPSIILECKKHPAQAPIEGMPRTYIGEILKAKIK